MTRGYKHKNDKCYRSMNKHNYQEIYDDCYHELSSEGKKEVDTELDYIIKKYKQHRDDFDSKHNKINKTSGIGQESAKELLIALLMKGHL